MAASERPRKSSPKSLAGVRAALLVHGVELGLGADDLHVGIVARRADAHILQHGAEAAQHV